jgi:peptide/nickel transport system ATP-binding protein
LIADEPTTALDVTVQAEILKLMRELRERVNAGIVLITHDMGVVADMADRIVVMQNGQVVETGTADQIFTSPQHPYTQQLLSSVPHFGTFSVEERTERESPVVTDAQRVMTAENLVLEYPKRGNQPVFRAVDEVSLTLDAGEVLGLVGESGSGKTTIGRAVVGLLPVAGGKLEVTGIDMNGASAKDLRPLRDQVGIVFQDPGSSLNPRFPIGESIGEPLFLHRKLKGKALSAEIERLLDSVHLQRGFRNRYPHELSGGQRQRVGIARALALEPRLLVADEPTSALDVSVQARVLDLFQELQREQGFACLFISHDLGVVEMLADRIAVMHYGKIVELGPAEQVVRNPQDDYTRRLVSAVPVPDPAEQRRRREARDALIDQAGIS